MVHPYMVTEVTNTDALHTAQTQNTKHTLLTPYPSTLTYPTLLPPTLYQHPITIISTHPLSTHHNAHAGVITIVPRNALGVNMNTNNHHHNNHNRSSHSSHSSHNNHGISHGSNSSQSSHDTRVDRDDIHNVEIHPVIDGFDRATHPPYIIAAPLWRIESDQDAEYHRDNNR